MKPAVIMTHDWLSKWNNALNDVQNTLNFLNEYVSNSGITMFGFFTPKNTHIAYITEIVRQLDGMRSTIAYLPKPVEYILASIKQEIHNYEYNIRFYDPLLPSRLKTKNPTQHEIVVYYSNSYEKTLMYRVISPTHKHITDSFPQDLQSMIENNSYNHSPDLAAYSDQILAITSARGHTRGPNIHAEDELVGLLEAITIKTGVNYFELAYIGLLDSYKNIGMLAPIINAPHWKKQGDFTQESNNNPLTRSVYYINTDVSNRTISDIHLSKDNHGGLALKVTASTPAAFSNLKDKIIACDLSFPAGVSIISSVYRRQRLPNKSYYELVPSRYPRNGEEIILGNPVFEYIDCDITKSRQRISLNKDAMKAFYKTFPNFNINGSSDHVNSLLTSLSDREQNLTGYQMRQFISIINHSPSAFSNPETHEYILFVKDSSVENLNLLARLLEVILAVEHQANIVCDELCDHLNYYYKQQTQTDNQHAIANVIDAQTNKNYRPIWDLTLAYKDDFFSEEPQKNITLEQLIQLYQSISIDNPHYADANFELCSLPDLVERNEENNYALLQQKFRYAFRSGHQALIDNFYNELCGRGMTSEKIEGIKGDEDILIAVANQLNEANKKLKALDVMQNDKPPTPLYQDGYHFF